MKMFRCPHAEAELAKGRGPFAQVYVHPAGSAGDGAFALCHACTMRVVEALREVTQRPEEELS